MLARLRLQPKGYAQ
ncbi:hypothetical protein ACI198_005104 [Escherichia coli]